MARVTTKTGAALTRQRVEELATEAAGGYDLSTAERVPVRRGRPSLATGTSPRISYRVAPTLLDRARRRAADEGRTVSDIARDALERYLAR